MTGAVPDSPSRLFREEALAHHFGQADGNSLLAPPPLWTWITLTVSLTLLVAAALFVAFADVTPGSQVDGLLRREGGLVRVVAALAQPEAEGVHAGDRVRVRFDSPGGITEGIVVRAVAGVATTTACPDTGGEEATGLQVDLVADPGLPDGAQATVLLTRPTQKLIDVVLGPLRRGS